MKRILVAVILSAVLAAAAGAEGVDAWAQARSSLKTSDLTVADWKALAEAESVERQERGYVMGASVSSFLLPGLGQFKVGDPLGGTLNLVGHVALVGGTLYGAWLLMPADIKNADRDQRREKFGATLFSDPAQVAPVVGIVVGGVALSIVQRFWASGDAKAQALSNLESGKVVFEPQFDHGFGFRLRM